MSWCGLFCDDKINVTETGQGNELAWDVSINIYLLTFSDWNRTTRVPKSVPRG